MTGTWAGLRPLVSDARSARTADLSRRHTVIVSPNGLVTVTGGKLTTYRRMAADTVDVVCSQLGERHPRSRHAGSAWSGRGQADWAGHRAGAGAVGAGPERAPAGAGAGPAGQRRRTGRGGAPGQGGDGGGPGPAARRHKIASSTWAHLEGRYGSETDLVVALCDEDASLADPLVAGLPYLRAEAVWAARHEMAHTLADVLARRTRALILDRDAAAEAAPRWPPCSPPSWVGARPSRPARSPTSTNSSRRSGGRPPGLTRAVRRLPQSDRPVQRPGRATLGGSTNAASAS